jgi:cytochrome P450
MAYFHAMYLFPEIAKKVYEEIVEVTGGTRMPTSADRPALRYTEAVWKETFRWNSFVPLVRTTRFAPNI